MCYNPSDSGPGPDTTAVICVYSRERNMFDVGFALVGLVEQDLKYKTDKQTLSGQYTSYSGDKVSCAAIFWNDGQPSTTFTGKLCRRTIRDKIDIWRLNVAYPKYRSNSILTGFWEVPVNYKDLTKLWHILKFMMDSNNGEFGILKMVCPPKRHFRCHTEIPRFEVWTNDEFCETLGLKLKKYNGGGDLIILMLHPSMRTKKVKTTSQNGGGDLYLHREGLECDRFSGPVGVPHSN
eukprot:Selendium_serpulae@DN6450_c2_g12_i2.p1